MAKWYVSAKRADFAAIGAKFGIDQVTARIIRNRGVIGDDAVNEFLNGKISDIADPALLRMVRGWLTFLPKRQLTRPKSG